MDDRIRNMLRAADADLAAYRPRADLAARVLERARRQRRHGALRSGLAMALMFGCVAWVALRGPRGPGPADGRGESLATLLNFAAAAEREADSRMRVIALTRAHVKRLERAHGSARVGSPHGQRVTPLSVVALERLAFGLVRCADVLSAQPATRGEALALYRRTAERYVGTAAAVAALNRLRQLQSEQGV